MRIVKSIWKAVEYFSDAFEIYFVDGNSKDSYKCIENSYLSKF